MSKPSTKITMDNLIPEYTCPFCGKRFVMPVGTDIKRYAYKRIVNRQIVYYHCYTCYRAAVKADEQKQADAKEARRKKMKEVFSKTAAKYREERKAAAL